MAKPRAGDLSSRDQKSEVGDQEKPREVGRPLRWDEGRGKKENRRQKTDDRAAKDRAKAKQTREISSVKSV
ncbi:MAG: hypothetical protein CVU57_09970 [Deltaproteobacteria bacterium HGW-Deltaproteobacteria-15]|jgi:hypothetical protein|nr:MAG: hypothetical protein CVU57_09970 [Deltaproteobacteria bacterium HGW-Deltaproteobacteria-15]